MRIMQLFSSGEQMRLCESPIPQAGLGELLIAVDVCGLNIADALSLNDINHNNQTLPVTPGVEVSGRIAALGGDVTGFTIGQRVVAICESGGLAEYAVAPAHLTFAIPDDMPATHAASFAVAYGTSHVALKHVAALQPDENLVVTEAAGGGGLTAIELGKQMGATVIACVRGKDRHHAARAAGADYLCDSHDDSLTNEILRLGGADVIYETVGGAVFERVLRSTNQAARIASIGFTSGQLPEIPANYILNKNLSLLGFYWSAYANLHPEAIQESLDELFGYYREGILRPHLHGIFTLEQSNMALDLLRSGDANGKLLVSMERAK